MIRSTRNITYHKHHRRKRRSNQMSSWLNLKMLPPTIINIAPNSMELKLEKSRFRMHTQLHPFAMLISLIICLVLYAGSQSTLAQQIIQAQSSNIYNLLPGHNMDNLRVSELEPVGTIVHTLKVSDRTREMGNITFALAHLHSDEYFSVDSSTGEVRLIKKLDRELRPTIRTVVSVLNNSETVIESKQRTILVEDADDSWPIFMPHRSSLVNNPDRGQYVFQTEVSERALPNSTVLAELIVTDADEGKNAAIVFECSQRQSSARACEMFSVTSRELKTGRYSVTIRTRQFLDYEREQGFRFCLVARGVEPAPIRSLQRSAPGGRGYLEAEAVININVLNVQDEGPQFVNAPFSLSLPENVEPGSRQLKLIVQDGDLAPKRDLNVVVAEGPFKKYFTVTRDAEANKVWYLETNTTLDREDPQISKSNNLFSIDLVAMELDAYGVPVAKESDLLAAVTGANYSKATLRRESVTILVLDQPDSLPVFVRTSSGKPVTQTVSVNISEALAQGVAIPNLDLSVLDLDQSSNSRLHLALVDSPTGPRASEVFALETQLVHGRAEIILNVINSSLLDYEDSSRRVFRLQLEASKQFDSRQLIQRLDLQLNLVDANDNWPAFDRSQYSVSVPEGSPPGHLVATIKATDRDSGSFGQVSHYLIGHGASKFKVVSNEGKILVADCAISQCLDYEVQSSYLLTYGARDGSGQTRNVSLVVNIEDVNDHAPKFSELVYKRELISDNLSSKQNYISPQLIVKARDEDGGQNSQASGNITYRIRSSNLTGLDVVPNSGLVYLAQPLDLDQLLAESQQIHGDPSAMIANRRKIVFEAEVVAQDSGSPPLNATATILLVVRGNRDGAPEFKQELYSAYVPESQPAMKSFFRVQAIDPDDRDSQLRYSLGYDPNDLISIDEQTGQMAFKTVVDYDDFKGKPYNVTVYATDNSRPYPLRASTVVTILIQDVNNRAPRFLEHDYKASLVQGKTKLGDVVLRLTASDLDLSANLNYSLLIENNTFVVHDRNGQQFSLDDLANSTSGYLSRMPSNDRLKLVDRFRHLLAINSKTGAIELRAEPDYSFASSFVLRARVVDLNQEIYTKSGEMQEDIVQCHFFLQTHIDRRPLFAPPWSMDQRQYNISIMEELPIETPIFSLLARDPHGQQSIERYEKVFESDPRNYFRVDRSGQVLINKRLDYEELAQPKSLQLAVKAVNGEGLFSVAVINVHLMDLNDNAPQFRNQTYRASISEAHQSEQPIVTLSAEDRDSGNFGQVYYSLSGISRDLFQIHPRKGVVSLRKAVKLDRDTEASHHLVAVASDCNETLSQDSSLQVHPQASSSCKRTSVPVEITLVDENDNDPVFVSLNRRGEYEATVSETTSLNSVIAQVVARDPDEGANGQIGYEIVRSDDQRFSRLFKIDSEGYISANGSLSGLGRATPYRLTVRAFDMGPKQGRQSFATLALTISDVVQNDGVPRFVRPRPDEIVTLPESAGPSTFVYQAQAVDPDEDANGKLMYKFLQPSDTFEIDPFEGVIKTQHRANFYLDREIVPNYTLIIVAQDLGNPPKQTHQVLTIKISDVNDNEPYFERGFDDPPLVLHIDEEVPSNTLIGTIKAIDKDVGQNALIGYEIIEGNSQSLFRLDWEPQSTATNDSAQTAGNNPCRIYSMGRLDRDTRESYTLTIRATSMSRMRNHLLNLRDPLGGRNPFNQYNASDLTKIRVTIKLTDINDNRPVFMQPNAKSVVDSSAEIYSQLMVVKAVDIDSSSSEMQYSILEAIYYSDSKFNRLDDKTTGGSNRQLEDKGNSLDPSSPVSMKDIFDIHPQTGILRNAVSLRRFTDGYFEVFVKADSGQQQVDQSGLSPKQLPDGQQVVGQSRSDSKCDTSQSASNSSSGINLPPSIEAAESCFASVTKAIIFVTHPRDTFRFVFNKTRLNDRLDEFKRSMQHALEDMMFDSARVQASTIDQTDLQTTNQTPSKAEKVYLNTFNTDFYERDDGSLDFSTITTCSQLVKFDDRAGSHPTNRQYQDQDTLVPNQVVSYDEVVNLLKTLNTTVSSSNQPSTRQQHQQSSPQAQQLKPSLFSQYGLVRIERCLPDKTLYRMTLSERLALYMAAMIALFGILLTFIVSRMRKNYERNLKILQRSKYQYMGSPYV